MKPKATKLQGDKYSGYMKMRLCGDKHFDFVISTTEFEGEWEDKEKRAREILKDGSKKNRKNRRYRLNFHMFDILGNKHEVNKYRINTAVNLDEMIEQLNVYLDEITSNSDMLFDLFKSYVVVRA